MEEKQQKKELMIARLRELKEHEGWKIVEKVLEANIREAESRLHGDTKLEEGETIEFWQKIRSDRKTLLSIPDDLIEEYKEKEEFPLELDPYLN